VAQNPFVGTWRLVSYKLRRSNGQVSYPLGQDVVGYIILHAMNVPKATLADENPLLGTWKLQSLVFEAIATGQRSSPFGDHPDGYLSYSADGRMYAIGVAEDRQNHATWFQRTRRK
jgi:Lipocalin-like domain